MPFTLTHTAAVFPLRRLSRSPQFLFAAGVGAMVPDAGYYFAPNSYFYLSAHTLSRSFSFCVPVGAAVFAALLLLRTGWLRLLAEPIRACVDARTPRAPRNIREALAVTGGLLAGAWTHILWDSFTHRNGYIVERWSFLSAELMGGLELYRVLQHLSTALGAFALIAWLSRRAQLRVALSPGMSLRSAFWLLSPILAFGFLLHQGAPHGWFPKLTVSLRNWLVLALAASLLLCLVPRTKKT